MKIFLIIIIFFSLSSQAQQLTPGVWTSISKNTMNDVSACKKPDGSIGCSWAANGFSYIMRAWNGGAFAENMGIKGSLLVWGGGHRGYYGNEIYRFDIDTLTWSLAAPVSPIPSGFSFDTKGSYLNANGEFSDGGPETYHTYNGGIGYDPTTKQFITFRAQGSLKTPHYYDFNDKAWYRFPTVNNPGTYLSSAYHPIRKKHYVVEVNGARVLNEFDLINKTSRALKYPGSLNIDLASAIDPNNDIMVIINFRTDSTQTIRVYDIATDSSQTITKFTGATVSNKTGNGSFEWVPSRQKFVWWHHNRPNDLYWLEIPDTKNDGGLSGNWKTDNWKWTYEQMSGANFNTTNYNGTFGRFRWVPKLDAFVCVTNVGDAVYAYKPKEQGTVIPDNTSPNQPTNLSIF